MNYCKRCGDKLIPVLNVNMLGHSHDWGNISKFSDRWKGNIKLKCVKCNEIEIRFDTFTYYCGE